MDPISKIQKDLPRWSTFIRMTNKLTDDFFMFDMFMPDMQVYQFCVFRGVIYRNREFMAVLNRFYDFRAVRHMSIRTHGFTKKEKDLVAHLEKEGVLFWEVDKHPYYKEKNPRARWIKGPAFNDLIKKIENQQEIHLYYFDDIKKDEEEK